MRPLTVREIGLTQFKNYTQARFTLGERFNLISGLNGIGKTNLLDALYYLSTGRSFFSSFDQRVVQQQTDFFRLEAHLIKGGDQHKMVIKVRPGALKELVLDGAIIRRVSDHLGFMPVVFSAPKDSEIVYGSSPARRKYTDHLLCQIDPRYLRHLMTYTQLLQMRNATLKQVFPDMQRIVSTYDEQMAPAAAYIFEKRKWLVDVFQPLLQETYRTLSENREDVEIRYVSQLYTYPYEVLADMNREHDRHAHRTNAGIHKDDFELIIKGLPAKEFGSQGQIKSLIFALHLSKYRVLLEETGFKPLLMLDDIFDKLDERRLLHLMDLLSADIYGQVFITDTSSDRVSSFLSSGLLHHIEI